MYEDGIMNFEVSKEEYDLLCNTFSNEMCSWVTIEVLKHYKERMKQIASEFFEDLFTIEKEGKRVPVNDYAKTLLEATKTILSGEDSKYGKLMIY